MPLLSIVVPTHNRGQYARYCIEAVLGIASSNIELVVTDTSTDNGLADRLNGDGREFLDDRRFVYARIDGPSNLTKNHNDAVALATGDYVCVIGDDDCITAAAIDAARWASANGVPVVSQTVSANYAWPDFQSLLARRGHAARLYVPRRAGASQWRQCAADLEAGLDRALQGTDALPRCYHGIVRRDLLETIKERTGAYFHGSSPDMSGAVSLACLIDRYVEVDVPLTIPGASGGSNSGRSAMNTHKGALTAESQTSSFEAAGWTAGVPRFFSVETVWAHAGLSAIDKLKPELVATFNYPLLLALCSLRHPDYRDAITDAARDAEMLSGQDVWRQIQRHMSHEKWARRKYLLRRAMRPTAANGRRYFGKLPTIASASRRYEEYARLSGFFFGDAVNGL
jgi:hypothetical protein